MALDVTWVETRGAGDATALTRQALAEGCTTIGAVGGDGTVNEIAAVVAGTPATLALVPGGSGNGLARHLGVPLEPARALALLRPGEGVSVAIDTGEANGHFFANAMGLGFDAEVAARFQSSPGRGLAGYLRTAWRVWRDHRAETCRIACDGEVWTQPVWLLAVANSAQYGNDVRIAPGARVADGLLDLVAVRPPGPAGLALLGFRLLCGRLFQDRRVRHRRGTTFRIERPAPGLIHVDGETRPADAVVSVAVQPGRLSVLIPASGGGDEDLRPTASR